MRQRTTELERLKVEVERSKSELVELGVEKTTAETANVKLKQEKAQLDEIQRNLHGKIRQLKRSEAIAFFLYFQVASSRRFCGSSRLKLILPQYNIPGLDNCMLGRLYDSVSYEI